MNAIHRVMRSGDFRQLVHGFDDSADRHTIVRIERNASQGRVAGTDQLGEAGLQRPANRSRNVSNDRPIICRQGQARQPVAPILTEALPSETPTTRR